MESPLVLRPGSLLEVTAGTCLPRQTSSLQNPTPAPRGPRAPAQPGEDGETASSSAASLPTPRPAAGQEGGLQRECRSRAGLGTASKGPSVSACVPSAPAKPPGRAFSVPHVHPPTSPVGTRTRLCTGTHPARDGGRPARGLPHSAPDWQTRGGPRGPGLRAEGLCCPPARDGGGQRPPTSPPRPGGSQSSTGAARGALARERLGAAQGRKHPRRLQCGGDLFADVGRTWQGPWGWPARGQSGRPEHRCPGPGPRALWSGQGRRLAPTWRTESLGPDSRRGSWPAALASHRKRTGRV